MTTPPGKAAKKGNEQMKDTRVIRCCQREYCDEHVDLEVGQDGRASFGDVRIIAYDEMVSFSFGDRGIGTLTRPGVISLAHWLLREMEAE